MTMSNVTSTVCGDRLTVYRWSQNTWTVRRDGRRTQWLCLHCKV